MKTCDQVVNETANQFTKPSCVKSNQLPFIWFSIPPGMILNKTNERTAIYVVIQNIINQLIYMADSTKRKGNNCNMMDQDMVTVVNEAKMIAKELYDLLHEDAIHRLCLYQDYSNDRDTSRWTPNLYRRCQLAELLYKKLNSFNTMPKVS